MHSVVVLGLGAATLAAAHQELLQLWRALSQPYHSGTLPGGLATAGGIAALALLSLTLAQAALGRTARLWSSIAAALSLAAGLSAFWREPAQRSAPGANIKCLEAAKRLHQRLDSTLQAIGQVMDPAHEALEGQSPFFKRPFSPLRWHIERVGRTDALPDGAEPGWLLVSVGAGGASFEITAVGIDESGAPGLLRDEGKPIAFHGALAPQGGE